MTTEPTLQSATSALAGESTTDEDRALTRPQVFVTPDGHEMAIVPMAEYRRLVEAWEDLADIHAYDEARRRVAAGETELIPEETANRLIDGENPVRVWREYRGLTVGALAAAAGISQAYLSQIETGKRAGTAETLARLAKALGLRVDDLI